MELPGYEPRTMQAMALGLAVNAQGADHNRSGAYEAAKPYRSAAPVGMGRRPDGWCDYFSTQWTTYTGVQESDLLGWALDGGTASG